MRKIIYIYIFEEFAEWEIGYLLQGMKLQATLNPISKFEVKTLAIKKEPIKSMGGLTIIPDCTLEEIEENKMFALILPGGDSWMTNTHNLIIDYAKKIIDKDILIAAICAATLALANSGIIGNKKHTSNSLQFLVNFSNTYNQEKNYINELSVIDHNLVTASAAGSLLWAKHILMYLDVLPSKAIDAWYQLFLTGDEKYYLEMINCLKK
ncbi:MAG: DJ-1/PfpI family protein [Mycoplasmoidaceae bacterium]